MWSGLVLLLNGFQVVRMVELLGLLGCIDYIRGEGGLGSECFGFQFFLHSWNELKISEHGDQVFPGSRCVGLPFSSTKFQPLPTIQ